MPRRTELVDGVPDINGGYIDEFFVESSDQSRVKTRIAVKYFFAWARVVMPTVRRFGNRIAVVDLYAGLGRYLDGTKSTPLLILERAIADPVMRDTLVTMFNDANPAHADSLDRAVQGLLGIETLRYKPKIVTSKVGPQTVAAFQKPLVPTFAFIDPYGYEGLSLGLVNAVIKDWACECLFFFNYNRINPGISNPKVAHHMAALFGPERLARLQADVRGQEPPARERLIMTALTEALTEMGAKYVLPFRFRLDDGRTSHYLIFVSKEFLGYQIMREVMAKESTYSVQGVATFEFNPRDLTAPPLFDLSQPLDDLMEMLTVDLAGHTLTFKELFERHSVSRFYVWPNYREALLRLEAEGRIAMDPSASGRRPWRGKPSLRPDVRITFPREQGRGAKVVEPRSTPAHPGRARPPSVSARPTA